MERVENLSGGRQIIKYPDGRSVLKFSDGSEIEQPLEEELQAAVDRINTSVEKEYQRHRREQRKNITDLAKAGFFDMPIGKN